MPEGFELERRNGAEIGIAIWIGLLGLAKWRRRCERIGEYAGEELEECTGNWSGE